MENLENNQSIGQQEQRSSNIWLSNKRNRRGEEKESSSSPRWVGDSQTEWFMVARWMNSRCQRAESYVEGTLDGQQTYALSQTGILLNIILLVKSSGWIWPKYIYTAVAGLLRNSIVMLHWRFYQKRMLISCQDISPLTWDGANSILCYFLLLSLGFYIIFQEGLSASFTAESLIGLSTL